MQGQRGEKSNRPRCGGDKRETVGETAREMLDSVRRREERKTESGEGKEGSVARWRHQRERERGEEGGRRKARAREPRVSAKTTMGEGPRRGR